jgi:hypothetical protein
MAWNIISGFKQNTVAGLTISVREPSDKMFDDFEFQSDIYVLWFSDGLWVQLGLEVCMNKDTK